MLSFAWQCASDHRALWTCHSGGASPVAPSDARCGVAQTARAAVHNGQKPFLSSSWEPRREDCTALALNNNCAECFSCECFQSKSVCTDPEMVDSNNRLRTSLRCLPGRSGTVSRGVPTWDRPLSAKPPHPKLPSPSQLRFSWFSSSLAGQGAWAPFPSSRVTPLSFRPDP